MKQQVLSIIFCLFCSLIMRENIRAQDSLEIKKEQIFSVKDQVINKDFTFNARYALPARSQMRYLAYNYSLRIAHDSLIVYLPYFGQSYVAPMDPANLAIDFTTTDFYYKVDSLKKGEWNITIRPKDQQTVELFILTAYENGKAYLNVTCTNRDPISFNGSLQEKK